MSAPLGGDAYYASQEGWNEDLMPLETWMRLRVEKGYSASDLLEALDMNDGVMGDSFYYDLDNLHVDEHWDAELGGWVSDANEWVTEYVPPPLFVGPVANTDVNGVQSGSQYEHNSNNWMAFMDGFNPGWDDNIKDLVSYPNVLIKLGVQAADLVRRLVGGSADDAFNVGNQLRPYKDAIAQGVASTALSKMIFDPETMQTLGLGKFVTKNLYTADGTRLIGTEQVFVPDFNAQLGMFRTVNNLVNMAKNESFNYPEGWVPQQGGGQGGGGRGGGVSTGLTFWRYSLNGSQVKGAEGAYFGWMKSKFGDYFIKKLNI